MSSYDDLLLWVCHCWKACVGRSHCFDATMVLASQNPEETLLAPVGVPAVCHNPILVLAFSAVADNFHSMSAFRDLFVLLLVINSMAVSHEASVHLEANLDGPILHQIFLHVHSPIDGVGVLRLGPREHLTVDPM